MKAAVFTAAFCAYLIEQFRSGAIPEFAKGVLSHKFIDYIKYAVFVV